MIDETTRDWKDGIFSSIFRTVNQPLPPERKREIRWIIFDGNVDAILVENLNSVMDDNRLLTLPNRERVLLQSHCAIIFEVSDLQYATPATISRCGVVWVDPKNLGTKPLYERWLKERYGTNFVISDIYKKIVHFHMKLFDRYTVPCIEYVIDGKLEGNLGERLSQSLPVCDLELCKQLCYLLDSFLPHVTKEVNLEPKEFENIYIFCLVWSIGAQLDLESKNKFDYFLKQTSTEHLPKESLYDYFYCTREQKWIHWDTSIKPYEQPEPFHFHKILVPTSNFASYQNILQFVAPKKPILFIGKNGTGKTLTCKNYLNLLENKEYLRLEIPLTFQTSVQGVRTCIESKVEKQLGSLYGPSGGKKLMLFIDDLHMPKTDRYGTQQPVTFLLTLLDHGFIIARAKKYSKST